MKRPLVTVLMALYNGGEYLKQSVQSILDQTYRDFELLIVDDCSTDHSLEIIQSCHDERIKLHHNERNLGQTKSLNVGLKLAEGGYIARIDADDVALPRWLETQLQGIKTHADCSVVSTYVFVIDERNKIKKFYKPPFDREDMILRSLIASPINHVGSLFKKKDIMENGGYDEQYKIAADYDLWGKLLRNNFRMTTTPRMLVAIREHARSLSRSERGKRELEEIKDVAAKNIREFISTKFSDDEVNLFCRANYDEGNLTDAEFSRAVEVTKKVYMNLAPSLKIEGWKTTQWTRKRCMTIYLKRILFAINRKDYGSIRKLSLKAMQEGGRLSIFTMLWGASLFGGVMLNLVPGFYKQILRANARLPLGFQPNKGMFTDLNKKYYYLDFLGLFSIGIFSLGYILFVKRFAEQHIQFSFLNFPIFVGEILLFICLLLFLAKYRNNIQKFTKWHYLFTFSKTLGKSLLGLFSRKKRSLSWAFLMSREGKRAIIICYFIFVILKVLSGYLIWGPLALRHAALLYYPAFAVFGYAFFRKDFFIEKKALLLFLVICIVFVVKHHDYWALTLMLLGLILIKLYPKRRYLMFLLLLVITPYKEFFSTSRMMIVGNFLSGLYLAGMLPLILEVKKKFKFALMTLIGGLVILGLFKFVDHGAVKSIVAFKKMAEVMRSCDAYIEANRGHFKMEERKAVGLYNPDKPVKKESSADNKRTQEKEKNVEEEKRTRESILDRRSAVEKLNSLIEPMKAEAAQVQDKTRQNDAEEEPIKREIPLVKKETQKKDVKKVRGYIESPPVVVVSKIRKPSQKLVQTGVPEVREQTQKKDVIDLSSTKDNKEVNITANQETQEEARTKIRQILRAPAEKIISDKKPLDALVIEDIKRAVQMAFTRAYPQITGGKFGWLAGKASNKTKEGGMENSGTTSQEFKQNASVVPSEKTHTGWVDNSNAVFRLLIWRDMLADLAKEKPVLGFDFGKPFRSKSLEILNWGSGDWARDGWIGAHNSYLEIIYRTGIVGILLILSLWIILFKMIKKFILTKSLTGVLLCDIIINWFAAANFLLIFELPYTAIPIWTIYGMTLAYGYKTPEETYALER